ncbi:hypothetical protein [Noviherbaspirillum sp.]|uniref:hypothetical protein n=1 Tax=Noviherbaspirillum sp. TaxID=1926288 RepID=UPI002B459984|nr:hypothetical protein [Noviherbaspirillum sp.]HJV82060.1 hypothetical protein [Noviherbaspirillum sp.]
MRVTDEMVQVAVKKAVEAGLLPRHACREDTGSYQEIIELILRAALELAPTESDTVSQIFAGTPAEHSAYG